MDVFLEAFLNLLGAVLEAFAEIFLGAFEPSDTLINRIICGLLILLLGGILWLELR